MDNRFQKAFEFVERQVSLQHFEKFVLRSSENKHQLFSSIRESNTQGFPRFNIWRMLLEIIPIAGDWTAKKESLDQSRKRWAVLKQQSKTGVKGPIAKQPNLPKNPLMKAMVKTEKKQVDSDSFLAEQIKKDVDRTYQQMQFFLDHDILKLLTNILFVWCKINSDVSYKQGMNELLASIVYVYFQETVPKEFEASTETQTKLLFLNGVEHAQGDIFIVFQKIMQIQKQMYKQNLDSEVKGLVNPNSKNNSPILQRIIQIQDQKLKALDLELFRIMKLQDVKTKTFLLRWIRCMHTREFGLMHSLTIWDSVFLDVFESPNSKNKHQFQFVDAMCLAMFIYMRTIVLTRQTANQILQIYQKYPNLEGHFLKQLITLAWSVCEVLRDINNANNQNNQNANWFEDSGKQKNLGLMERGGYADTFKKQQIEDKKKQKLEQEQNIMKETEQIEKQVNSIFNKQSPLKSDKSQNNGELFGKPKDIFGKKQTDLFGKPKEVDIFSKSRNKQQKKPSPSPAPIQPQIKVVFEGHELKQIINSLKKSIALNDDIQSRALANHALKLLENKVGK